MKIVKCLNCSKLHKRIALQDIYCIPCRIEKLKQDDPIKWSEVITHLETKNI